MSEIPQPTEPEEPTTAQRLEVAKQLVAEVIETSKRPWGNLLDGGKELNNPY
jgi:hypothetical protein